MRFPDSVRARLILGATLVLAAFVAGAGFAVERAHADSVRTARFAQLQSTVYLLLAGAEVNSGGELEMPDSLPEPRLSLPGSGLYAHIANVARGQAWQSASAVALSPPFQRRVGVGEWRYETLEKNGRRFLAVGYGVNWTGRTQPVTLVLSVLEDKATLDRELAAFTKTLWSWLGGAALLLLLSQTVLLEWGLAPLRRVIREMRRVENGEQPQVQGRYPQEIAALTDNLNALIRQERVRQTRYQEALSFLAHSLKTPLAVLRSAMSEPGNLPGAVAQQVARMDDIVEHQLARARASGATRFAPPLLLAPVMERIRDSLAKVYADKGLAFTLDCAPGLAWRIDEGDAFEMLGNLMDNAGKWARHGVAVRAWLEQGALRLRIDDDGAGFADTQSILRLHVRGDEQVPGHGVGLAVVSDLVASHHGTLGLSRSEMGGARVDISLPSA